MLNLIILTIFTLLFIFLTRKNFSLGLVLFFFLLPSYLLRFQIGCLPTTLLEIMFEIIFIVWVIKYKQTIIYNLWFVVKKYPTFFIATALFLLTATISVFTSSEVKSALGEWKAFYVEPIILFLIIITSHLEKKSLDKIIFALVLSGLLTSMLAVYQHFTGWLVPEAFWSNRNTYRVTAWYGFPNGVGIFLAPLIPLAIYGLRQTFIKFSSKPWQKCLFLVFYSSSIILSLLAIIYSKGTGPLIGAIVGIGFLLLINKKTRWYTISLGIAGILCLLFLPQLSNIKKEITFGDRSGQIRLSMWNDTWNFLKDNPLIGAGLASYSEKIVPYHSLVNGEKIEIFHHPHNIFLTMWVNLGILGLISFIVILIYSLKNSLTNFGNWKLEIGNLKSYLIASLLIVIIMGLVDSPYIKNDSAMFFWLLLALILNSKYDLENTPIKKIS